MGLKLLNLHEPQIYKMERRKIRRRRVRKRSRKRKKKRKKENSEEYCMN